MNGGPGAAGDEAWWGEMRFPAACVLALGLVAAGVQPASAARAGRAPAADEPPVIQVVTADDEADKANPGVYKKRKAPPAKAAPKAALHAALDQVFGEGRWRQTSGFRTVAQENALRRQGAGTVAPGRISRHSVGVPDLPGAYDVVAVGMSQAQAAAKLKAAAGGVVAKVATEAAHGNQGAHLHIELTADAIRPAPAPTDN